MNKVRIDESTRTNKSIVVRWTDGMVLFFDRENLSKTPVVYKASSDDKELVRRIVVSRTSAQAAAAGTEVYA